MNGTSRLVISCTDTKPLYISGVTSVGTVTESLMRNFFFCDFLQAELLTVNVVVGVDKGINVEFELGTLDR